MSISLLIWFVLLLVFCLSVNILFSQAALWMFGIFINDAFTQINTKDSGTNQSLGISFPQGLKNVSFTAVNFQTKI